MSFLRRSFISFNRFRIDAAKTRGLEEFYENGIALPKDKTVTGRAWLAAELRNKSFEDLQKIWIVLLKERNLLSTQREEARAMKLQKEHFTNTSRMVKVRKSMARVKTVLTERYHAQTAALKENDLPPLNGQLSESTPAESATPVAASTSSATPTPEKSTV
ncbi:mitochondrial 39-S ribosomal protein L47 (MRP-L47)-domain-containing protein [Dimargaris cristalligena]|uniref:Large ribosomal subunit protein uL29m n=1 Tax=Dimargaris cristalligena TaxID=215637 RepID=A0A4V1J5V1_9FUNG|nr:mitochondrial 39-S ribosomal protein L47 (MRP-L47)-domain-containing protein [Dimargaris cristalligena]|eukprot:RKP40339.1 mitochondrial 39-S ribosomal protein L47 (MRP-L47)-domain-containing protein [Dimargaris cristalligena]